MIILSLDTAGSACSVAIADGDSLLAAHRQEMRHGHAEALMPMVDAAMREAGLSASQLDAVAVSLGPGGFTGIRVGLAATHGIALASNARLIGVTSFAAVAASVQTGGPVLVALDSRRADLYVQLFNPDSEPEAILPDRLGDWVAGKIGDTPLTIAGDAVEAAASALSNRAQITALPDTAPDARGVLGAAQRIPAQETEPSASRAFYLRPPDVTFAAPPAPRPAVRRITKLPLTAAEPLAMLHRSCFPDDPWNGEAMARVLGLSGCFGHLAWERGEPCGFVLARDLGDECEILSIGVEPAARRSGLGGRLLRAAIAEARRRGVASIVLEVASDNTAARRLYTGLGFLRVGFRPRYYRRRDGLADALILRLALGNTDV
jgi:tRNA threonylcarbamoyl adenosine modification protein YeaZ